MTSKRAEDLLSIMRYEGGGCLQTGAIRPDVEPMTESERSLLGQLWKAGPGYCSMFDVVNSIAKGRIMVTAARKPSEYEAAIADLEAVADDAERAAGL